MDLTTAGRYRVLGRPRDPEELLLVELPADGMDDADPEEAFAPTYVDATGYDDGLAAAVGSIDAGNVVDADLTWHDGTPRFDTLSVVAETTFTFADGVTGMFEAAKSTWMVAEAENEGMNARVTRSTDGDPNGALYVFAKQSGARDLFSEFRNGIMPLEPLIRRVDGHENSTLMDQPADHRSAECSESGESDRIDVPPEPEQPRAVFVMRPTDEPFIVVYIVFNRDGMLAKTVRDTYV
ncbi:hypothetical protein ELS19_02155 [Halogeometricum borinquense]|uniref:Uncharacterized protein n=1 Tax=Halogeometricum borinquense TaxID=60847 RepID=A0A482T7U8_9EURY|nr:DUF6663 family protein [Halogeometricum borinquense]RYJ12887.1 hypothetical protein ELS19_02155 [Halogeometricum borinquense]